MLANFISVTHHFKSCFILREPKMTTADYDNDFDPKAFLDTYYKDPRKLMRFGYQQYAKFFSNLKEKDLKLLEYGGGPVLSRMISACPHVQEVVFAEYLEANRKAVEAWVNEDPTAFDWGPTFDFIVQELEEKGPDEVAKRKAELRHKIRAVVPCDLRAANIMDIPANLVGKYGPPYDVVTSSLCIESVAQNNQEFKEAVAKITKFIRPGGYLLLHGALKPTFYTVGSKKFYSLYMDEQNVVESMKAAGLKEIEIHLASSVDIGGNESFPLLTDTQDFVVAHGRV